MIPQGEIPSGFVNQAKVCGFPFQHNGRVLKGAEDPLIFISMGHFWVKCREKGYNGARLEEGHQ